ncbi:MASE3 domain-containing protein [Simplicispira lacusdiani]|uniref:MASE3 domain-containing protein n=1 Tax=Simplicispira lacusdiani TaxID=2213010 RepID=UPI000E739B28|nr:MASE3 domain-containing protein [Simplicispira lacusdiani]
MPPFLHQAHALPTGQTDLPLWRMVLASLVPPSVMSAICWWSAQFNYLLFHTLAELFSIVIAMVALVVSTTTTQFTRNHFVVYIAVAFGWCGGLDLAHTLVFQGMNLLPGGSANPSTQLWIAARFIQAAALVSAPLLLQRNMHRFFSNAVFGSVTVLVLLLIMNGQFPDAFVDGQGLTSFKIYTEYLIIGLLACALLLFWRHRALMSTRLLVNLMAAVVLMMLSELAFTRYVSVYAQANLVGHLLKIFAYWYVYLALVQNTLREPFSMLARAASTYDAVPDPTLIVAGDGRILQANTAASLYTGMAAEQLVGQSCHALFHDAAINPADCPVCSRLRSRGMAFSTELAREQGRRAVECSLAPFGFHGDQKAHVQVVRDITDRQRLAAEREALVQALGERIKELRCMHAIAQLIETPDLQLPQLLNGVTERLPPGFMLPDRVRVAISGNWGHFGARPPESKPTQWMARDISVHGTPRAQLQAWYPPAACAAGAVFLPEEETLLDSVVQQIGGTIERMQAAEKVQRLSNLYEMLSATNHAVVHSSDQETLLARLYDALITHGSFPMMFIALTETGGLPLRIHRTHGIAAERLPLLIQALEDPGSPFNQLMANLAEGEITVRSIPADANTPWLAYLHAEGIRERAVVPLVCEGRLLGAFGLYARGLTTFDADEMRLLTEMASDLSFAFNNLASEKRLTQAEQKAQLSEYRFSELFEASPLPMLIYSLNTRKLRASNRALQQWLGYTPEDIATITLWAEHVFADPEERRQRMAHWESVLPQSKGGQTVQSPELRLRCKDGSERTTRGTMTVVNDEAIIAWTDLTEIRQNEHVLRESEQRFRNMIEQTISGIYVRRHGRFIYVNPRFCEIVGWSAPELLGQEVLQFTATTPDNLERIHQAWGRLDAGEPNVAYSVPLRRKDGRLIELGLNARVITWDDGQPATIVMAQDITERKQAEEQIASYVRRLEGAMQGTLQAISNMVELRDPYTAGHERRVGLIAGAIARELGWDEARCKNLELVGLVHDIGKIAVPAEILSKPGRLSPLEMELVKCHAQAGYDILKDVDFATPVAEIIRQHHERMDGSGYPRGLQGDAILPEARVLAVADVVESMAAHRPYRPALGLELAMAEIDKNRGRLYDTEVADAMARLVREKDYRLPH